MSIAFTLGLFGAFIVAVIILAVMFMSGILMIIVGAIVHHKEKKKKYPIVIMVIGSIFIIVPSVVAIKTHINPINMISEVYSSVNNAVNSTNSDEEADDYMTTDKMGKQQSRIIIESTQKKDTEAIKELFCEQAKRNLDLDSEIKKVFDFIDGNIISYGEPRGGYSGGRSTEQDGTVEERISGYIDDIKTDTGKTYSINFEGYYMNKYLPETIGVWSISVCDEDVFNYENAYPEYGRVVIGL